MKFLPATITKCFQLNLIQCNTTRILDISASKVLRNTRQSVQTMHFAERSRSESRFEFVNAGLKDEIGGGELLSEEDQLQAKCYYANSLGIDEHRPRFHLTAVDRMKNNRLCVR